MKALSRLAKNARRILTDLRNLPYAIYYKSTRRENPPIFIVGCGHSGTSILLTVLGSHSRIYPIPFESQLVFDFETRSPAITKKSKRLLRRFDKQTIAARKMRWVEKTPSHICCIAELLQLCPDSKILLIVRDGRDVACSIQDRTGSIEEGIDRWVTENKIGQAFWNHPQVHMLKYEAFIEDFDKTMSEVMAFLGETFEETMRHHHETPKLYYAKTLEKPENAFGDNHVQYRNWQINQPIFDGRGKWGRLSEPERNLIKTAAGDMLIEYGYAQDKNW